MDGLISSCCGVLANSEADLGQCPECMDYTYWSELDDGVSDYELIEAELIGDKPS